MGIFGKTDNRPPDAVPRSVAATAQAAPSTGGARACVIGPGTRIKGELQGTEAVLVEGVVEGSVRLTAELRVAAGGRVSADVAARAVVVAGEVVGDCNATERVEIEASGRLTGNIRAPRVVIVEGATFRGTSDMSPRRDGEPA
jgi:cytoskeletal protein CcmA (bactofilin family)